MAQIYTNNATSTLAGSILVGATTCAVQALDAAKFPNPGVGDFFLATIVDGSGNREIVKCTARVSATLTIVRGQEGTTPFAFASGARIDLRLTAGTLALFQQVNLLLEALGDLDATTGFLFQTGAATFTKKRARELGEVIDYAGAAAPAEWLLCFGQAISRTTYAALFAVIGTTFGVGDGSTTFNLPDLRGRVVAGQDDMGGASADRLTAAGSGLDGDVLGGVGGLETNTLTSAQLNHTQTGNHTHSFSDTATTGNASATHTHATHQGTTPPTDDSSASGSLHTHSVTVSGTTGAATLGSTVTSTATAHNNVQPTIILNKIIYAGV